MTRLKSAVTVLLAWTAFSSLAAFARAQKSGDLKWEPYLFEAANKEKVEAEMGRLLVPENRLRPDSRLIEISFVRFKSTSARPGFPIVYLAGGPGGSGIAAARGSRFPLFMAMREIADVIALNQRGIGPSSPSLICREPIDYPLDQAPEREGLLEAFRRASRTAVTRLRGEGVDLSGYNTNENADDLEDLRKALGAEKISLWAISYGTHLSLAAIKRHESRIDRAILAGVEGLNHTIKLPADIQSHLIHIDRLVKNDAELSRDVPDFLGLMARVFDQVERAPVTVPITDPRSNKPTSVTINKFALQLITASSFGSREAALPAWFYAMSRGDFSVAARSWLNMIRNDMATVGSAMAFMMDCSSGVSPDRLRQIREEAKATLLGDVIDWPQPEICDAWGNPDLGESFRRNPSSRIPVLFISGTFDVRTPVKNAEEVRRGFPSSEHLIIEGAVHSDPLFLSSPKIKDVMLAFMKGNKIPTSRIELPPLKFQAVGK